MVLIPKSAHSPSIFVKGMFNRELKMLHKEFASKNKENLSFRSMYDLPLIQMLDRLNGIKKQFKNIAFIGPNPYFFL